MEWCWGGCWGEGWGEGIEGVGGKVKLGAGSIGALRLSMAKFSITIQHQLCS